MIHTITLLVILSLWNEPISAQELSRKYFEKDGALLEVPRNYLCAPNIPREKNQIHYYDKSRRLQEVVHCRNDSAEGIRTQYFTTGKVAAEIPYRNNRREGKATYYFKSGKISRTITFSLGRRHGLFQRFSPEEVLLEQTEYRNGQRHGTQRVYDPAHQVTLVYRFFNDVRTGEPTYEFVDANAALSVAVTNGHSAAVNHLLAQGANPNSDSHWGTPLELAARFGKTALVKTLVSKGAQVNKRFEPLGDTVLIRIAAHGSPSGLRSLLQLGAQVNAQAESTGNTALMVASKAGNIRNTLILLDHRANKNLRNKQGKRAINLAASEKHHEVVALLSNTKRFRAQWDQKQQEKSCQLQNLSKLIRSKKMAAVNRWLSVCHRADPKGELRYEGLIEAIKSGDIFLVKQLLDSKTPTEIKARANDRATPLIWAAIRGNREMVSLLLTRGAATDPKDRFGNTALMFASEYGHSTIVSDLLKRKANTEIRNQLGRTALSLAVEAGQIKIVRQLLSSGAQVDSEDEQAALLSLAKREGHAEIEKLLRTVRNN